MVNLCLLNCKLLSLKFLLSCILTSSTSLLLVNYLFVSIDLIDNFKIIFSYLLPDKGRNSKQKTNVARKTCNPNWNQTLTYRDVSPEELADRSLELTVWDHDRLGSNEFLGGVRLSLGSGNNLLF